MIKKYLLAFGVLSLAMVLALITAPTAVASSGVTDYSNSHLMDDAVFNNVGSMNETQIQAFLASKGPCLQSYDDFTPSYDATTGWSYSATKSSAAHIIALSALEWGLNPQVILATLEKEESLVAGGSCDAWRYSSAMGYGCPDSGGCNAKYAGFTRQVLWGSWQLKFNEQRSLGNTSWDGDDTIHYVGYMTQGAFKRWDTDTQNFYAGFATIDGQTTYLATGATASLYTYTPHLNQSFPGIFERWFGPTVVPSLVKSSNGMVYLYAGGYKIYAPTTAILQDYGFNPYTASVFPQQYIDSIPTPDAGSGISTSLGYIVKTTSDTDGDGPTVYVVSMGKKYPMRDFQQFTDYGFANQPITYLPESSVASIPSGPILANFIRTPASTVFKVSAQQKQMYLDYQAYISANPSDVTTLVSTGFANSIASGNPISTKAILVRTSSGTIYLYSNSSYYLVPNPDVLACWGFLGANSTTMVQLGYDSYVLSAAPISALSCLIRDATYHNQFLLDRGKIYSVPASYGLTELTYGADIIAAARLLPDAGRLLPQAIKLSSQDTVWFIESGAVKRLGSYISLLRLQIDPAKIEILDPSVLSSLPISDIKLGPGQLVVSPGSPTVYVIYGNFRAAFSSAPNFLAYGNSFSSVESYDASSLDRDYPFTGKVVSDYFYSAADSMVYIVNSSGCYSMSNAMVAAYGQSTSTLASNQDYDISAFSGLRLTGCAAATAFVKSPSNSTVYLIAAGQKSPFLSWSDLLSHNGGAVPVITTLSDVFLSEFPTTPAI